MADFALAPSDRSGKEKEHRQHPTTASAPRPSASHSRRVLNDFIFHQVTSNPSISTSELVDKVRDEKQFHLKVVLSQKGWFSYKEPYNRALNHLRSQIFAG
jgi:hypothetical protein